MNEEKPKCFTEEELKEMYELAKNCTKYTLKEEDFKEIRKQMEQDGEQQNINLAGNAHEKKNIRGGIYSYQSNCTRF